MSLRILPPPRVATEEAKANGSPGMGSWSGVIPPGSHRMMFLISRKNAFRAEVQKLVP